jgi:hypothetical protein
MITVEQHQNQSNHINFARTDVDSIMKLEPINESPKKYPQQIGGLLRDTVL